MNKQPEKLTAVLGLSSGHYGGCTVHTVRFEREAGQKWRDALNKHGHKFGFDFDIADGTTMLLRGWPEAKAPFVWFDLKPATKKGL